MSTRIEALIKELLQALASELDLLVRHHTLDALRSILEERALPARGGRRAGQPARVYDSDDLAKRIASAVAARPGQTESEIGSRTGAGPVAVKETIQSMLDSGELRKTGQRRATRYFPAGAASRTAAKRKRRVKRRTRKERPATVARKTRKPSKPKSKPKKQLKKKAKKSKAVLVPTRRRPKKRKRSAATVLVKQAEATQLQLGPGPAEQAVSTGVAG